MSAISDYVKNGLRNWIGLDQFSMYGLNVLRFKDASPEFNTYDADIDKLNIVLQNPACLKVFALQCDLFSLAKVYVYKDGKIVENDPFLGMFDNPNPFQNGTQFMWDFMFWNMLGNDYTYIDSRLVGENKLYHLELPKMNFPNEMMKFKDRIVLSNASLTDINNFKIKYLYSDGTSIYLPWNNILHTPDLSNGTGNWFKGNSRIDALYKVISNSEAALDSKNINVRYAGKYMVSGQADPDNVTQLPLTDTEKKDIETKMNGRKSVHAVKSMIDIKRFVENIANLKLDESYWADYFIIGGMYNIPKDVLEWYLTGATFENQDRARMSHVSYCLQPKADIWFKGLSRYFGYLEKGLEIVASWDHLDFMQSGEKERAETQQIKSQTLLNLQQAGVKVEEINEYLDLDFSELNPSTNESQLQTGAEQREDNTNT